MNRRGFIKLLAGVSAIATMPVSVAWAETKRFLSFDEIVTNSIEKNKQAIVDNITAQNAFLKRISKTKG